MKACRKGTISMSRKKIRIRNDRWQRKPDIMRLLSAVQKLHRFDEVLDAQEMMYLEWFVLDCMPIAEMMEGKENITEEYGEFLEGIGRYTLREFYDRAILMK